MKHFSLLTLVGGIVIAEVAFAQTLEVNIPIHRQGTESYEQMLQRAGKVAKTSIEQRFKQEKSLEALKVVVIGENQGAIAPLISVQVTRQDWQTAPDVRRWAIDFPFSKTLLGFEASTPKPQASPASTDTPPPATTTNEKKPSPTIIPDGLPLGDPDSQDKPQQSLPNQRLRMPSNDRSNS